MELTVPAATPGNMFQDTVFGPGWPSPKMVFKKAKADVWSDAQGHADDSSRGPCGFWKMEWDLAQQFTVVHSWNTAQDRQGGPSAQAILRTRA